MTKTLGLVTALALSVALATGADAKKPPYPTFTCASTKQKAAANYCKAVLKAWSKWETKGDDAKREGAVAKALANLEKAWGKADDKAAKKDDFDCAQSSFESAAAGAEIDSAIGALVDLVNHGLAVGTKDAKCGQKLLSAAAVACNAIVKAQAKATKQVANPKSRAQRDKKTDKALTKAHKSYTQATKKACGTTATEDGFANAVDDVAATTIFVASVSSDVPEGDYLTIPAGGDPVDYDGQTFTARCMNGSPYVYFAKRGTVNKLLVYYQGGGACWEQLTCSIPTCANTATENDNPGRVASGFADLSNPDNPFRDWNAVFVTYCSCDVHFGDAEQDYANFDPSNALHVEHRGFQNAKIVEKFAREHFVNPDTVFVTGSSAGAYGAWFHAPLLHDVWPAARFHVLADAGNGVITQEFREEYFPNWNFEANVPPGYPEIQELFANNSGIPEYTEVVAGLFPETTWSHYTSAFDGDTGGQSSFYNVMLKGNNPVAAVTWWDGSCAFNDVMRDQAMSTYDAIQSDGLDNYRYYIGTGSRHTMFGSDKVYDDTTGGVPPIVDWVNAQVASGAGSADPAWQNVECSNCGLLLAGDPRPNPLEPPFEPVGEDVVIMCAASPSGAFVDPRVD